VIVRRDLTAPSRRDAEALRGLLNAEPCIGMIRAIGAQGVVRPACPFACEQLREVAGPDECFHVGTAPPQAIALATKHSSGSVRLRTPADDRIRPEGLAGLRDGRRFCFHECDTRSHVSSKPARLEVRLMP
jgi:hypothetical protein